jgi:PleD family two-component response regulator
MKSGVIVAVDELFFAAKIRATADRLGLEVVFPRSFENLIESAIKTKPALVIVDLHLQRYDPFLVARRLKENGELRTTPLVGFFSHVQTELRLRAIDAGYDHVLARSAFTKRLPEILQGQC